MLFFCVLLLSMRVVVEYPITVHVDKIGDILLSENTLLSQRMTNLNLRHHFI